MDQCSSQVGKRAGCKRNWAQSSARTTKIRAQFSAQTTQNRAHFYSWTTKIWSQSSTRTKRGLGTLLWAIDENMGTNLQAFYKHFYIGCLKTQKQQLHFIKINNFIFFFSNSGKACVNRARRKTIRAGRSALGNGPRWNTQNSAGTTRVFHRQRPTHLEFVRLERSGSRLPSQGHDILIDAGQSL